MGVMPSACALVNNRSRFRINGDGVSAWLNCVDRYFSHGIRIVVVFSRYLPLPTVEFEPLDPVDVRIVVVSVPSAEMKHALNSRVHVVIFRDIELATFNRFHSHLIILRNVFSLVKLHRSGRCVLDLVPPRVW